MIFEDVFYPDNPNRRRQVYELRGEIISIARRYKAEWNDIVLTLNAAFAEAKSKDFSFELMPLSKDIDRDSLSECIVEIDTALKDAKEKLPQLIKDMNIEDKLPKDWATNPKAINLNPDTIKLIGGAISGIVSGSAGLVVFLYIFSGVRVLQTLLAMVIQLGSFILSPVFAAVSAAITGSVAFVITDMVVSAITGAIERKKLTEAIDALKELKEKMKPLDESISKLAAINLGLRKGSYQLDDSHILRRNKNGEWRIIDLDELCMATGSNVSIERIISKLGDEDGILLIAA